MPADPCPWDEAPLWSKVTFWWLNPLFRIGSKRRLDPDDMYDVPVDDEARKAESCLNELWTKELKRGNHKPNLFYVVLMAFRKSWMLPGMLIFISESIRMLQPFLIGRLIAYFSPSSKMSDTEAYMYGLCLGVSALLQVFANPMYFFWMHRVGMRMRTAMSGLIYRKVLTLNSKSFANTTSGMIVNLLSTDVEKFINASECLHFIWITPISTAVSVYLIYKMVGLACTFGLTIMVVIIPVQIVAGRAVGKLRLSIGAWSDKRIHMMTEIVSGMRVIKMYCWEKPFSKLIISLRNKEIRYLKISFVLRSVSSVLGDISPRLMALFVFVGHWLAGYPPLPLQNIFMTIGWLAVVRMSLFIFLYYGVEAISELVASLSRVRTLLLIGEDSSNKKALRRIHHETNASSDVMIEVTNVSASWESSEKIVPLSSEENLALVERQRFSLRDIDFKVRKGELLAVVGTVGSGKSSLLSVLLEDLPCFQGQVTLRGSLAYSCQQSWVFSGTVRDNILFGDELDVPRYELVLQACALSKDISRMPYGDQTLVGERGLLLSGGQKARLTLARAVYRKRDIYLLDDPLSAVDTKVGKHIFNNLETKLLSNLEKEIRCICELLKGSTRVLITHQIQYLKAADRILVMVKGQVVDVGSYEDFASRNLDLSTLMTDSTEKKTYDQACDNEENLSSKVKLSNTDSEVQEKEKRYFGSVAVGVYMKYFQAGKGFFCIPMILLFFATSVGLYAYSDWLLAQWTETVYPVHYHNSSFILYNGSQPLSTVSYTGIVEHVSSVSRTWYTMLSEMRLYIICCVAYFVFAILSSIMTWQMTAIASKNLHNQMFRFVLGSRTRFFDQNPVGRILNRFARDIGFLDALTGNLLASIFRYFIETLSVLIVTLIICPWLLIPITPVIFFIGYVRYYSVQTTRDVRRLEGIARSPVYSHLSDTINGLQTIRAMKKESQSYDQLVSYQNTHTSAWFVYISSYRWFSIRTNFTLALYTVTVNFVCIALGNTISRGLLALALTYCSALGEPFERLMRITAEFENLMTSAERIVSYTNLEQEGPVTTATPPPPTWPTLGNISFKDTCLKYSSDSPLVLKHLNFDIHAKEKIGIVGRTGAGKSSLLAALLRLSEPEGSIIIDDIDVTKIGLHELRRKISVIPQDPVLFTGTMRTNLDPFDDFSDKMIWSSLEQVQLVDKITSSVDQLDMAVTEYGGNFSVGERQLICLARALLRNNKILILDEATANVDHRTDELIQRTIRDQFKDCTVLTIAHRLHTVMDSDRILVLDDGVVKEFDVPYLLLQNQDGFLRHFVQQTGTQQEQHLISLAKQNYNEKKIANPGSLSFDNVRTSCLAN